MIAVPAIANTRVPRVFDADLEDFRKTRGQTLSIVQPLSQKQFDSSPAPGKWSVGEVVDHLVLLEGVHRRNIEKLIRLKREGKQPYLRVSLAELDVGFPFLPKFLMPWLELPFSIYTATVFMIKPVLYFITRNRLIPATAPTQGRPRRRLPADELRENLKSSLERTSALFEANADLDFRELTCQHALLGINNVPELLAILTNHEKGHQSQIKDIVRKIQS